MNRLAASLPRLDRRSTWVLALLFGAIALGAGTRAVLLGIGARTPAELAGAPRDLVFPAENERAERGIGR